MLGACTRAQQSASFCFMPPESASARRPENASSCRQMGSMVAFSRSIVVPNTLA